MIFGFYSDFYLVQPLTYFAKLHDVLLCLFGVAQAKPPWRKNAAYAQARCPPQRHRDGAGRV